MNKENREVFKALSLITQIGLSLLTTVFLCVFIGYKLDEKLGTNFCLLIGLILGLLAGFRNIYGLVKSFYIKDKIKEDKEIEYFKNLNNKNHAKNTENKN